MSKFMQIIGQISRLRCASLEMTTKWIPAPKAPIQPNLTQNYDLFMQNKANFRNGQMNISSFITSKYERLDIWWNGKTNPIQSQSKPVLSPFGYTQGKLRRMGQFQRQRNAAGLDD
jgi:hypothetical protein